MNCSNLHPHWDFSRHCGQYPAIQSNPNSWLNELTTSYASIALPLCTYPTHPQQPSFSNNTLVCTLLATRVLFDTVKLYYCSVRETTQLLHLSNMLCSIWSNHLLECPCFQPIQKQHIHCPHFVDELCLQFTTLLVPFVIAFQNHSQSMNQYQHRMYFQ